VCVCLCRSVGACAHASVWRCGWCGRCTPLHFCAGSSKSSLVERVHEDISQASSFQAEEDEALPLEFGKWTSNIACSVFDGIPTIKATENKIIELAPSARGGVGMPTGARAQWTFRLEQAKGIISVGMANTEVALGMPYRKPELRDKVWYYTTDGVLRSGARSIGRKGPEGTTGDVVIMRLAHEKLTFLVNDVPIADPIPNVTGAPLFATVQIHRKGDAVSLIAERFDDATLHHIKFFSWGKTSLIADGAMEGLPAAQLSRQRTCATSCHKAPDAFGSTVPSVRSAAVIENGASAQWELQIEMCKSCVYIGLQQVSWQEGLDWWCEAAVGHVWYYSGDGSLRSGNNIIHRSSVTYTPKAGFVEKAGADTAVATFTPFIPALRNGDFCKLKLENKVLSFTVNDRPVEGEIVGVTGRVRLAVQFEDDGDSVCILPR